VTALLGVGLTGLWALWVLAEAARGRQGRIEVLGLLGTALFLFAEARGVLSRGAGGLWALLPLAFLLGCLLAHRVRWLHSLDWLLGPVEAVAALGSLLRREPQRAAPQGQGDSAEALEQVKDLGRRRVAEVMVSRSEMDALEAGATVEDWARTVERRRRSRYPVYQEHLDRILGMVTVRDLLASRSPEERVERYARPVLFVPETKRCDDLIRELWHRGEHLAVVVDEYGGVAGLVTREDLLEILVGELLEEATERGPRLFQVGPGEWFADAQYRIEDFEERFGPLLPETHAETLGGILLERLGRIPERGERLVLEGLTLEVVSRDARRIHALRIRFDETTSAPHGEGRG
jgi:Mg2+/Co2+ transporter CorC